MSKIAFFLPFLAGGGAERVCITLAEGFLNHGLEVDFVLASKTGPLLKTVPKGARIVELSARRTFTALLPLAAYLRRENPFALIAAPDHANLIAIWAKLLASNQTKVLIGNHIFLSVAIKNSRKIQEKIYPFLLNLFYRQAGVIVAVSRGAADEMARIARIPRDCIQTIYNPFPLAEITRLGSELPTHPWFFPGEPPVILAAGRLSVQKDFFTLLRAFTVVRSHRRVRLVILGEGEELTHLQSLVSELGIGADVDFPGFLDPPYPFMTNSRVFVNSSAWEGFGNVLVEALACGAQVVATDCPSGPAEILEDGEHGRLVPVGDVIALADAIEDAIDHPLPVEGLKFRAKDFSSETAVDAYLQVLGLASNDH
jgi:glycosyltransferase involved in cell wall biosynthesis